MNKDIELLTKRANLPLHKKDDRTWITIINNSVIQFDIDQAEANVCFWVGDKNESQENGMLDFLLEKMAVIASQTNIELIFDIVECNYSLRIRMEEFLGDKGAVSGAIDDLLWAHELVYESSTTPVCTAFLPFNHAMLLV